MPHVIKKTELKTQKCVDCFRSVRPEFIEFFSLFHSFCFLTSPIQIVLPKFLAVEVIRNIFLLFRPLLRGQEQYTQIRIFFFRQFWPIDYIHRRELRLVSLKSLSSVEYRIKIFFLRFSLFTGSDRGLNLWGIRVYSVDFIHSFRNF